MRKSRSLLIAFGCFFLSACVTSLLIGNQLQSKLMWSLLKPIVGFDPNEVKLFEHPAIKNRMVSLLGDKYEPTMKLLGTAQKIQQEGVLFYVISQYAPDEVKQVSDKAAMVWNGDTNQMAVMLVKDGVPQLISEQVEGAKEALMPTLPSEVQTVYAQAQSAYKTTQEMQNSLKNAPQDLINQSIQGTITPE